MSKKTIILLSFLIISPVIIYFLWPSDTSRIKKLFREGAKAIETEKIDDVMSKVSFNYTDEYGMTYLYMRKGMERVFSQMEGIDIEYEIKEIRVTDKTASAELEIRVIASIGNDTGYIIGDLAKPVLMTFSLDKDRTTWLVTGAKGLPFNF